MPKEVKQCCGTCKWATWPNGMTNHKPPRPRNYWGNCQWPFPNVVGPLSAIMTVEMKRGVIWADMGESCDVWEPKP